MGVLIDKEYHKILEDHRRSCRDELTEAVITLEAIPNPSGDQRRWANILKRVINT